MDSLLTQRTSEESEASRRIKTEFLVQLDGAGGGGTSSSSAGGRIVAEYVFMVPAVAVELVAAVFQHMLFWQRD